MWNKEKSKEAEKGEIREDELFNTKVDRQTSASSESSLVHDNSSVDTDHTQRKLYNRHLQLIAIGGSIGTGLFVTIGTTGLTVGGTFRSSSFILSFDFTYVIAYICCRGDGFLYAG